MGRISNVRFPDPEDGMRLVAMGRIPRCEACPRYQALVVAHMLPGRPRLPLPAAPVSCSHRVCAPLVNRYEAALELSGSLASFADARGGARG
jgi:hypothetical protein